MTPSQAVLLSGQESPAKGKHKYANSLGAFQVDVPAENGGGLPPNDGGAYSTRMWASRPRSIAQPPNASPVPARWGSSDKSKVEMGAALEEELYAVYPKYVDQDKIDAAIRGEE